MPDSSSQNTHYIAYLKIEKVVNKPRIPGRYPDNPPQQEASREVIELGNTTVRASDMDSLRAKVNGVAALIDD
jgi:hypothetical protein